MCLYGTGEDPARLLFFDFLCDRGYGDGTYHDA